MIIETFTDGVRLWVNNNVTSISGDNVDKICRDIYSRVMQPKVNDEGKLIYEQIYELYVDVIGIGLAYKDCLTHMGLEVHDITKANVDKVLPKICHDEIELLVEKNKELIEENKALKVLLKKQLNDVADDLSIEPLKICESESDHDWECCGISSNGDEYRCRKCNAKKLFPLQYSVSLT